MVNKVTFFAEITQMFFLEARLEDESLEPLIDFLACLDPKFWPKTLHFGKNSSPAKGNLGHFG